MAVIFCGGKIRKLVVSEVMLDFKETCNILVPSNITDYDLTGGNITDYDVTGGNITDYDLTGGHPIRELLVKIATFYVKVSKIISVICVIPYSHIHELAVKIGPFFEKLLSFL